MATSSHRSHKLGDMELAAILPNLAVFAADLATSLPFFATILPLLPPRTRNVTSVWAANRLECGVWVETATNTKTQSGKNGNVDHPTQHCHPSLDGMDGA